MLLPNRWTSSNLSRAAVLAGTAAGILACLPTLPHVSVQAQVEMSQAAAKSKERIFVSASLESLPEGALTRMGSSRLRHDHNAFFHDTAFSSDSRILATGGQDTIRLWDVATGNLVREIRDGYRFWPHLQFSPDGKRLVGWAGPGRGAVRVWETTTGRRLLQVSADGPALAWSPNGERLVIPSKDGTVFLWDTTKDEMAIQLRGGHAQRIHAARFSADGKVLITLCAGKLACKWDVAAGKLLVAVKMPSFGMLSPDGRLWRWCPLGRTPSFCSTQLPGSSRSSCRGS